MLVSVVQLAVHISRESCSLSLREEASQEREQQDGPEEPRWGTHAVYSQGLVVNLQAPVSRAKVEGRLGSSVREVGACCGPFNSMFTIRYENHTFSKYQENILKKVPISGYFYWGLLALGEHNQDPDQLQLCEWASAKDIYEDANI